MTNPFRFPLFCVCNVLLLIGVQAQSQLLVREGNQWNTVVWPTFNPNTSSYREKIGEDTIINNLVYHKVYTSNDKQETNWKFNYEYIRQDSMKRVYSKSWNKEEVLLYDFSLELNDTFFFKNYCDQVVTEIDSIQLNNGEFRKRMKMVQTNQFGDFHYWIEGVGSTLTMLNYVGFCLTDFSLELLCFYSDGELLYPESPPSCFITATDDPNIPSQFDIYPNPFTTEFTILSDLAIVQRFTLVNLLGHIVLEGEITQPNQLVECTHLPSGYYILSLTDETKKSWSQKLIKIH